MRRFALLPTKRTTVTVLQYQPLPSPALIRHHQDASPTRRGQSSLVIVALAMVPAAFWASLAWLVWGQLGAAIAATVVLAVSILILAVLRSAGDVETPVRTHLAPEWRQAA